MLDYEQEIYKKGFKFVVGCDEAGRGPLCGPVVAAAVILPPTYQNEAINDSKKLSEKKREELYYEIVNSALAYAITIIEPKIIDEINIYEASRLAMVESIKKLKIRPDYILTDAMPLLDFFDTPKEAIIKGDAKALSIASASILAKVTRDHIMDEYDKLYPQYNYKKNKGYPTKEHLQKLEEYGPINDIYRFSYGPLKKYVKQ